MTVDKSLAGWLQYMRFQQNCDKYLMLQLNKMLRPEKLLLTVYRPGCSLSHESGPDVETRATMLILWKFGPDVCDGVRFQPGSIARPLPARS